MTSIPNLRTSADLLALIERARTTPITAAMIDAQRRSWVIGEMMLDDPHLSRSEAERRYQQAIGGR